MVNCISGFFYVNTVYFALAGAEGKQTLWSTASLFFFYVNIVYSALAGAEVIKKLNGQLHLWFF